MFLLNIRCKSNFKHVVIVILISPCSMDIGKPELWWRPCKTRSEPGMCRTPVSSMDSKLPSSQVVMNCKAEIYVVCECCSLSEVSWSQCVTHMPMWHSTRWSLFFPAAVLFLHKKVICCLVPQSPFDEFVKSHFWMIFLFDLWFCIFFHEGVIAWTLGFFLSEETKLSYGYK